MLYRLIWVLLWGGLAGCGGEQFSTPSPAAGAAGSAGGAGAAGGGGEGQGGGGGAGGSAAGAGGAAGSSAAGSSGAGGAPAPADLTGKFTVKVVNLEDGCALNFEKGAETKDIELVITQDGDQATGTVGGLIGVTLNLWVGTNKYVGTVVGDGFTLIAYGTKQSSQGTSPECPYTLESEMKGTLDGDQIEGGLIHRRKFVNSNPACQAFACTSTQSMKGTRPPK